MHCIGEHCKNNDKKLKWYTMSTEQGFDLAQLDLGIIYEENEEYKKAEYWCKIGKEDKEWREQDEF